jgi:hypothetical protein
MAKPRQDHARRKTQPDYGTTGLRRNRGIYITSTVYAGHGQWNAIKAMHSAVKFRVYKQRPCSPGVMQQTLHQKNNETRTHTNPDLFIMQSAKKAQHVTIQKKKGGDLFKS